jgi:hypothetical protein
MTSLTLETVDPGHRVTEPGFYRMPAAMYHDDPVLAPSLSNSIAKILVNQSPLHAWTAHPRLNPHGQLEKKPNRTMEIGSVAHALLLDKGADIVRVDAPNWQSKVAQAERADAYESGLLPILEEDFETAIAMVKVARAELALYPEIAPVLADDGGISEIVAVWRECSVWCRAMIDRCSTSLRTILDYKTTGDSHPDACAARIANNSFQMQEPFYVRGLDALDPDCRGRRKFFFLYQEQEPPFACTVHQLDGHYRAIGERQVETAINTWAACMAANRWPSYPRVIHQVAMKPWEEKEWLEREVEDEIRGAALLPAM